MPIRARTPGQAKARFGVLSKQRKKTNKTHALYKAHSGEPKNKFFTTKK